MEVLKLKAYNRGRRAWQESIKFNFYRHAGVLFHFGSLEGSNLAVCFRIAFLCVIIRPVSSQTGTISVLFHTLPPKSLSSLLFSCSTNTLHVLALYCCFLWIDASSSRSFQRAIKGAALPLLLVFKAAFEPVSVLGKVEAKTSLIL